LSPHKRALSRHAMVAVPQTTAQTPFSEQFMVVLRQLELSSQVTSQR
jgi:hypothetical protein